MLSERGDLALHASAVTLDGHAVLFCGPSGRGKSTLALLASQLGHPVVSEDGVVLTVNGAQPAVWPGPRGVQVSDATAVAAGLPAPGSPDGTGSTGERRRLRTLGSGLEPTGPAPVAAICHLAVRGDELSVKRLSPTEALPALAPNLIHAGGPEALRPAFALLARAVQRTALYRVTMPDRLSEAPSAARALLERLGDRSERGAALASGWAPD
jgi:energy-coupling factor transporter ATP-binding protein EcfA2